MRRVASRGSPGGSSQYHRACEPEDFLPLKVTDLGHTCAQGDVTVRTVGPASFRCHRPPFGATGLPGGWARVRGRPVWGLTADSKPPADPQPPPPGAPRGLPVSPEPGADTQSTDRRMHDPGTGDRVPAQPPLPSRYSIPRGRCRLLPLWPGLLGGLDRWGSMWGFWGALASRAPRSALRNAPWTKRATQAPASS